MLSAVNTAFIRCICRLLGIHTRLRSAAEFDLPGGRVERLVRICKELGATEYVSGPRAKDYLEVDAFTEHGVGVTWFDYAGYPEYEQRTAAFEHQVSVIDLLMCTGTRSQAFMKTFGTAGGSDSGRTHDLSPI